MRRPLAATVALTALLLLAGCTGGTPLGGSGSADGHAVSLASVQYPAGVTNESVDAKTVSQGHEAALANRSLTFHLQLNQTVGGNSRSGIIVEKTTGDGSPMWTRARMPGASGIPVERVVYQRGDKRFERTTVNGNTSYRVTTRPPSFGIGAPSPSGSRLVNQTLSIAQFTPTRAESVNGTTLVVLTASKSDVSDAVNGNVSRFDASMTIDQEGVVHSFQYNVTMNQGGQRMSVSESARLTNIGSTTVPRPNWLDEANASSSSA